MAHADYSCCACCDEKMYYDSGCDAKEYLCSSCAASLGVGSVAEFIEWMDTADPAIILPKLEANGFHVCYYSNPTDDAFDRLKMRIGIPIEVPK